MKYKPLIGDQMSGSMGGITASRNAAGTYFRQRSIPVNPATAQQQAVRNAMSQLAAAWVSVLSSAQRAAWVTYSDNVPLTDKLGAQINVGGLPMYQRSNVPRLQAGLPRVDDAPTIFDLGDFTTPTLTVAVLATALQVSFDNSDAWANEDDSAMLVYGSRPVNASIAFFKGPYRLAGTIDGDSTTPPTSPATLTNPFPFVAGQRVFTQFRVSRADGRLSSVQRLTGVAS